MLGLKQRQKYAQEIAWLEGNDDQSVSIRSMAAELRKVFDIKKGAAFHLVRDFRQQEPEPDWEFYQDEEKCDGPELQPIQTTSKHQSYYRSHDDQYVFVFDLSKELTRFDMPAREVQWAIEQYVYAGAGMTQKQVCRSLYQRFARKMTADYFKMFLGALGVDKNSLPIAPHRFNFEDADSLVHSWRERQEALVEIKKRSEDPEHWEKRALDLRSKLTDVQMFVEQMPSINIVVNTVHRQDWEDRRGIAPGIYHQPVLTLGDWHLGAHASLDDIGERIWEGIAQELELLSGYNLKNPRVLLAGDMLEGVLGNMRPNHANEMHSHGIQQIRSYVEQVSYLLAALHTYFGCVINVDSVYGNHDRVGSHRSEDPSRVIHDTVIGWLSDKLRNVARFNTAKDGRSIAKSKLAHGTTLLLYHGDTQPKDWRRTLLMNMDRDSRHHLLVSGHRHTPEVRLAEDLNVLVYQVGSPKSGKDDYAPDVIGVDSRPSQQILLIGPRGPQLPGQIFL